MKPPSLMRDVFGTTKKIEIIILDIGVMFEGRPRYEILMSQKIGKVIGFEPNPVEFDRLNQQQNTNHLMKIPI
ncbi:MAG: hypothetical protein ACKVIK_14715 [Rhodospirillales bacterium]|jgi:hypothetical protein